MHRRTSTALWLSILAASGATGPMLSAQSTADLVLRGGRVATVDAEFSFAEAVAVGGYQILATGSNEAIAAYIDANTEVIELDGRLAIPGFIEGHGHYLSLGRSKMILDLTTVTSWQQIITKVAAAARLTEPGEWIFGRGWHQEKWDSTPTPNVDGVPLHDGLSEVTPDNPVVLGHASGHAAFANELAMRLAGIDSATDDPDGGTIVRDARGRATGLLRERAQGLVREVSSAADAERSDADREAEFRRRVEAAGAEALSNGITSFQDAGTGFASIDRFRAMAAAGELPVRLYVMVRGPSNEEMDRLLPQYRIIPEGNDFLAVRSIKRVIDGALGSHGAWLLENYADMDSPGLVLVPVEELEGTATIAAKHGFQLNSHAIGDRANREVLDLYERTFDGAGLNGRDLRWRIEHAQHIHPDDVPRFSKLGVVASMQGVHATSDGPWVALRLGDERAKYHTYMWRDLIDSGALVTNGTDVPVERIDPIVSFHASVTRIMADGTAFYPEQSMTRQEALRSYTINNAYAAFEEHLKGSLEPGKLADIVVLSQDILEVPVDRIRATRVDLTIIGGESRYAR
ncbi:MAG TPA: amidohydrolase [Acidobacteriota bacterium]|nr:amidohydrolase [Acidobacteriota bacterium]